MYNLTFYGIFYNILLYVFLSAHWNLGNDAYFARPKANMILALINRLSKSASSK